MNLVDLLALLDRQKTTTPPKIVRASITYYRSAWRRPRTRTR